MPLQEMNIAIVGVGLIGGSTALALRNKPGIGRILGVDRNEKHLAKALELGLVGLQRVLLGF